jgi:hypothetical protein
MSTWLYLECRDHTPALRGEEEVGQHEWDLPRLRKVLVMDPDRIKQALEKYKYDSQVDPWDEEHGYFFGNTIRFLVQHPHCNLWIVDEMEQVRPLEEP